MRSSSNKKRTISMAEKIMSNRTPARNETMILKLSAEGRRQVAKEHRPAQEQANELSFGRHRSRFSFSRAQSWETTIRVASRNESKGEASRRKVRAASAFDFACIARSFAFSNSVCCLDCKLISVSLAAARTASSLTPRLSPVASARSSPSSAEV